MSGAIPVWEQSKENVLPIKSGRNVKVLNQSLSEKSSDGYEEQEK